MASLLSVPAPPSVLVVAAHPDDIEFMAGGTLTAWAAHGSRLHYLLVTDGAGGSRDPRWTRTALAAARRSEQRRAAAILGAASVTFLGRQDATLEANDALRLDIARVIRQIRPAAVLTFDPHLFYRAQTINHFDHLAVGAATLGAVMPLANTLLAAPVLADEGLEPHDVEVIYLFEPAAPTHWMPLSAELLEHKIAALCAHTSQLADWNAAAAATEHARQTAVAARAAGLECALAEAFSCVRLSAPATQPYHSSKTQTLQPRVYAAEAS